MSEKPEARVEPYDKPAGGRGAVKESLMAFKRQGIGLKVIQSFQNANKPGGFDCPGCAFPDKSHGLGPDSCEQGQKAISWEMTHKAASPEFFAQHTLAALRNLTDYELENQGRLTHPLLYDQASDTYRAVEWTQAYELIGVHLRALQPDSVAFYASGRSSNEAAFLWQLLARSYGCNNLPDSSNLCHEPSGYAMKEAIGMGKGTCSLDDFEKAELIMVIGQNPATNHPRMMGALHEAAKRGATIIALNPLQERGFTNFSDPKDIAEMLTDRGRQVAKTVYQVKIGGDLAALKGVMRVILEADAAALASGAASLLDRDFIAQHTTGFAQLQTDVLAESWPVILQESGLSEAAIREIAALYMKSNATMATWCMGITHHENSVATIQTILNLLLLRGNIGKPGAGAAPIRGHSNVQGDRTMGITVRAPQTFLDNLEKTFDIKVPQQAGKDAAATVNGIIDGSLQAFLSLGGNFGAAVPDSWRVYQGLAQMGLTVHIATKFNRTHCYPGKLGLILPCYGRTDIDIQHGVEQFVTVEDSMSMVHSSQGVQAPLSPYMMSEPAIVAQLGHAAVGSSRIDWLGMTHHYDHVRDKIETCIEGVFHGFADYNRRIFAKGGFWLTNWAAQRVWKTTSGKAEFKTHAIALDGPVHRARARHGEQVLTLMTIRSHDQFNTTVYGQDDRYRGVFGGRHVVFIHPDDLTRLGFRDGDYVDLRSCSEDNILREVKGFRLIGFNIPPGCIAAYFPEATPLAPAGLLSKKTNTPASKEIPVLLSPATVRRAGGGQTEPLAAAT